MATEPIKGESGLKTFFSFPHPVNEYAARALAGLTFATAIAVIAIQSSWLLLLLVYLFAAGVVAGPKITPTGWLAVYVIGPRFIKRKKIVAGPPKQFAQGVGMVFSVTAAVLAIVFGQEVVAFSLVGVLVVFSGLEAFAGFCMGCFVFGYLMKWGVIPAELCQRCNDITFGSATSQA
jgi:hypothetical protein